MATHDPQCAGPRRPHILIHFPAANCFDALLGLARTICVNDIGVAILYAETRFLGFDDFKAQADRAGVALLCRWEADHPSAGDLDAAIAELCIDVASQSQPRRTDEVAVTCSERSPLVRLTSACRAIAASWSGACNEEPRWGPTEKAAVTLADTIIERLGIDLFVTCAESTGRSAQIFIAAMRAKGLRSLYVPIGVPSVREVGMRPASWEQVRRTAERQRDAARLFRFSAHSVHGQEPKRASSSLGSLSEGSVITKRKGCMPGPSRSDAVGLSSILLMERLVEIGAAHRCDTMFLIGAPEDPDLALAPERKRELRREVAAQFGWRADRPIVLFCPPADFTRQYPVSECASYHDLLDYWTHSLRQLRNFNVLVSPHPWLKTNEPARKLMEATGVALLWREAIDLVPAADVIATFGASPIPRLAAAMGLPVLNYLCFDAGFPPEDAACYFVGFDTMPVARTRGEWEALLADLDSPAYFRNLSIRAQESAHYFGLRDGAFAARLAALIATLVGGRGPLSRDEIRHLRSRLASRPCLESP